jgi:hypothetical protein
VPQLRDLFATRSGVTVNEGVTTADDYRWTVSGGAVLSASDGYAAFKKNGYVATQSQILRINPLPESNTLRIHYWIADGTSQPAYRLNTGGSWVSIVPNSALPEYIDVDVSGLSGDLDLYFRGPVAAAACRFGAVETLDTTTAGVKVNRIYKGGSMLFDAFSLFATSNSTNQQQARSQTTDLGTDLLILAHSPNNVTQGYGTYSYDAADVAAGYTRVLDYLTTLDLDVLITAGPWRDTSTYSTPENQAEYDDAVVALADNYDRVTVLDWRNLYTDWEYEDDRGLVVDQIHPSLRGHSDMAEAIFRALTTA